MPSEGWPASAPAANSRLGREGRGLIVVSINEATSKADNAHTPYVAEEIAASGLAAIRAGASILHFHARSRDGAQIKFGASSDYQRAVELIAADEEALSFPVTYPSPLDPTSEEDAPHLWDLAISAPPRARPQMAPYDCWRKGELPWWDEARGKLSGQPYTSGAGEAREWRPPPFLSKIYRLGMIPYFICFEVGDVRWVCHLARAGVIRQPVLIQFAFFGRIVWGPAPNAAGIEAMLSALRPDVDAEVIVGAQLCESREQYEATLEYAADRGLSLRVGLGDCGEWRRSETNAELVEWASGLLARSGRTPATAVEVKRHFGA